MQDQKKKVPAIKWDVKNKIRMEIFLLDPATRAYAAYVCE